MRYVTKRSVGTQRSVGTLRQTGNVFLDRKVSWDPKVSWTGGQLGPPILRPQLAERRRREASRHECPRLGPAGRRPARA